MAVGVVELPVVIVAIGMNIGKWESGDGMGKGTSTVYYLLLLVTIIDYSRIIIIVRTLTYSTVL